jgi:4-amino-4-deoxy-L-arabinose transferase-like glycosyltransferase
MFERVLSWTDAHIFSLLMALLVLRGGFLYINGMDLIGDESYYWDWSRQPDWCYFSKPPMVAWLIAAATGLFGDHAVVVRLPTLLLGTLFLFYFHATAKAFYGPRAAAVALLLMLATPINLLANFLMTIDPPLYCFWIMSLYYLRKALFEQQSIAWFWAGLASAAALLSKQAALVMPVMLLFFLLIDRQRRCYLKHEYGWYLLPMVGVSIPILLWNQQHNWVMFGHSQGHFGNHDVVSMATHLQYAVNFFVYQLLLISPVTFVLVMIVSVQSAFKFRHLTAEQQFLWLMGPLLVLAILLLSFLQKVQGNWPMPFYISGLILLAGKWAAGSWKKSVKFALTFGYLLVLMTYMLPLLLHAFNLKDTAFDPTKRFKNWQELAVNIHFDRLMSSDSLDQSFVVALGHRYLASQLAFYLPDHPQVYRYEESGQVMSQYEVWPGPDKFVGKNAFIIGEITEENLPVALKNAFSRVSFVAQIANPDNPNSPYYVYLAENLVAWPSLAQRAVNQ